MSSKTHWATLALTIGMTAGSSAAATNYNPGKDTANIRHKEVLEVRLPGGLCEFQNELPMNLVAALEGRRDLPELVGYMLENCPELGLFLADMATASTSAVVPADRSEDAGGNAGTGQGTPAGGPSGNGNSPTDDDGNNGHGDEPDGHDDSNPGKGKR